MELPVGNFTAMERLRHSGILDQHPWLGSLISELDDRALAAEDALYDANLHCELLQKQVDDWRYLCKDLQDLARHDQLQVKSYQRLRKVMLDTIINHMGNLI